MGCIRDDFNQPVCLTLVYNIFTGSIISSTVESNACELTTEFDFESKNLTIRVPFVIEGTLNINDHFQANYMTRNIFLKSSQLRAQQPMIESTAKEEEKAATNTVVNEANSTQQKRVKTKKSTQSKK